MLSCVQSFSLLAVSDHLLELSDAPNPLCPSMCFFPSSKILIPSTGLWFSLWVALPFQILSWSGLPLQDFELAPNNYLYLRPNIKRGMMSEDEKDLIIRLHKLLGNRWSLIAGRLPGRTDNEVKNFWNTHLNKRCRGKKKHIKSKEENSHSPKGKESREYPAETANNQEVATKAVLDSWIEEMQDFNCSILSPLSMNSVPFLEHEPFIPILDNIVLLEAFTGTGKEAWNDIQPFF